MLTIPNEFKNLEPPQVWAERIDDSFKPFVPARQPHVVGIARDLVRLLDANGRTCVAQLSSTFWKRLNYSEKV
jgi:hypothetical protein